MKNFLLLVVTVFLWTGAIPALADDFRIMNKEELRAKLGSHEVTILDVRSEPHWNASDNKIPGAIRLPGEKIDIWSENFHKNTPMVLYCACDGLGSSGNLARRLVTKGFTNVYALQGGWSEWLMNSYPVVSK